MNKKRLSNENNHHIIFNRHKWDNLKLEAGRTSKMNVGELLRGQGSLIVPMDTIEHEWLHRVVVPLPVFGAVAVHSVLMNYTDRVRDPSIHPVKAIDLLQISMARVPERNLTIEDEEIINICLAGLDEQRQIIGNVVNHRRELYEESMYRARRAGFKKSNKHKVPLTSSRH